VQRSKAGRGLGFRAAAVGLRVRVPGGRSAGPVRGLAGDLGARARPVVRGKKKGKEKGVPTGGAGRLERRKRGAGGAGLSELG
jgi:hypothetical protein